MKKERFELNNRLLDSKAEKDRTSLTILPPLVFCCSSSQKQRGPVVGFTTSVMRTLKFHEKKLLKKVDLLWKKDENLKEVAVLRRYHIQKRDDYIKCNKLCGIVTKLVSILS